MKVTISDVARLAGVSTATVSHTINQTRYVSEETRDKVYAAIRELGYTPEGEELDAIYQKFLELADRKKDISIRDLEVLAGRTKVDAPIKLETLQVVCGQSTVPTATVQISFGGDTFTETACGNGPVDAAFNAVKSITKRRVHIEEFLVQAITRGSDDLGKVHLQISHKGKMYYGFGANTDIVTASGESLLDALSKIA